MTEYPDEPRTATERRVDFAIGVIVGTAIASGVFFLLLGSRTGRRLYEWLVESLGAWMLVLGLFVTLGCGYLNYRLGAALWSRK
jgi:hypothetical protein